MDKMISTTREYKKHLEGEVKFKVLLDKKTYRVQRLRFL